MNWSPVTWVNPKPIRFPDGLFSPCAGVPAPIHEAGPTYRFYFRFPYDWDVFTLPPGSKVGGGLEVGLQNRNEDGFFVDFYYKTAYILTDHIMGKYNQIHVLKFDFCVEQKTIQYLFKRLNLPNLEYLDFNRSSRNSGWELQLHEVEEFRNFFKRHPRLHTLLLRSTWGDTTMAEMFNPKEGFIMPCMEVLDLQRDPRPNVSPFTLQVNEAKQFATYLKDSCPLLTKLSLKGLMEDNALSQTVRIVMMPYLALYEVTRERDPILEAEAKRLAEVAKLHVPVKLVVNATWEGSGKRQFEAALAAWKQNFESSPAPPPPPPPVYQPPPPPPEPVDDEDEETPAASPSPSPPPAPSPPAKGAAASAAKAKAAPPRSSPPPPGAPRR